MTFAHYIENLYRKINLCFLSLFEERRESGWKKLLRLCVCVCGCVCECRAGIHMLANRSWGVQYNTSRKVFFTSPASSLHDSLRITQDNPAAEGAGDDTMVPQDLATCCIFDGSDSKIPRLLSHRWSHMRPDLHGFLLHTFNPAAQDAFAAPEEQDEA